MAQYGEWHIPIQFYTYTHTLPFFSIMMKEKIDEIRLQIKKYNK